MGFYFFKSEKHIHNDNLPMFVNFPGSLKDEFTNHQGYIEVTNLSEENDPEDLDVSLKQYFAKKIFQDLPCHAYFHSIGFCTSLLCRWSK